MRGKFIVIRTNGDVESKDITKQPSLEELQAAVGGYIEGVNITKYDGEDAVAFCNEEGKLKRLPMNQKATRAWRDALGFEPGDILVGDVAIVTGDDELLEAI
jgi:hypothetical protein